MTSCIITKDGQPITKSGESIEIGYTLGRININPTNNAQLLAIGVPNQFLDRLELDALFDPWRIGTTENDQKQPYLNLVWDGYQDLTPNQALSVMNYLRRLGYVLATDSNGDSVVDVNGDYAIAKVN